MKRVLIIAIFFLIGLGVVSFSFTLWKELSIFPFDKISLTSDTSSSYFKDRFGGLYWGFLTLSMEYRKINADKSSFIVLSDHYAEDNFQVFYYGEVLSGADTSSFKVVPQNYSYVLNRQHIYEEVNDSNILKDSEKEGEFAFDQYYIYFNENRIASNKYNHVINFATNILIADADILVGDLNFGGGLNVISFPELDTNTFHPYTDTFWADKNSVYCFSQNKKKFYPLSNLNRASFKYYKTKVDNQFSHVFGDGNNFYYYYGDCLQTTL